MSSPDSPESAAQTPPAGAPPGVASGVAAGVAAGVASDAVALPASRVLGLRGRPEAAAVAWPTQARPLDQREHPRGAAGPQARGSGPTARTQRTRGALQAALAGAVAAGLAAAGHPTGAWVVGGVALVTLSLALLSPLGLFSQLDRAMKRLGRAAGVAVSWLALTPVFVGFFVPFGLLFRRGRNDPLRRAWQPEARSYWRDGRGGATGDRGDDAGGEGADEAARALARRRRMF